MQLAKEGRTRRRVKAPDLEARALVILGDAQAALDRFDDAVASYEASHALFRQIGRPTMLLLPLSGLARTELKRGNTDVAERHVADIVAQVDARAALDGLSKAAIFFDCFHVMATARHSRADEFLRLAYDEVTEQAQQLEATERTSFLKNVATNAAILEATRLRLGSGVG